MQEQEFGGLGPWGVPILTGGHRDFPGDSVVENPSANAGDTGSIPDLRRSPGEGNGTLSSILA